MHTKTICLIAFFFLTSTVPIARAEDPPIHILAYEYAEILVAISNLSLHKQSMEELHKCILESAYTTKRIPKRTTLKKDVVIPSCLKKDEYSRYFPPVEAAQIESVSDGNTVGLGIDIDVEKNDHGVTITALYEDEPAALSGKLREDDIVIAIGNSPNDLQSLSEPSHEKKLAKLFYGPHGSTKYLQVIRNGRILPVISIRMEGTRSPEIEVETIGQDIGVMAIHSFYKERLTKDDIILALKKLLQEGRRKLVLVLNDNLGGSIKTAYAFLELFSPHQGISAITVKGRDGETVEDQNYTTQSRGPYADWKIAIVVNSKTASAAEIVAGVLQTWGHIVFGQPTARKGSIQQYLSLSRGSMFSLTTARYYLSDGTTPDEVGITPDVIIDPNYVASCEDDTTDEFGDTPDCTEVKDPVMQAVDYLKNL